MMEYLMLYFIGIFIALLITSWFSKGENGKIDWDNMGIPIFLASIVFPLSLTIGFAIGICSIVKKIIEFVVETPTKAEGEG